MIVDPAVSRRKFAREVEMAEALGHLHKQGIWILRSEYPIVFVAIVTPQLVPAFPAILAAVHIDFTDYDVRPPSVRFVDPFTERYLTALEIRWPFPKANEVVQGPAENPIKMMQHTSYVQSFDHERPFLCVPGVREYHECSGHSGDSWFLHRGTKPSILVHILTMLQRYGSGAIGGVNYQVLAQIVPKIVT